MQASAMARAGVRVREDACVGDVQNPQINVARQAIGRPGSAAAAVAAVAKLSWLRAVSTNDG